jgi:hypothetical protein
VTVFKVVERRIGIKFKFSPGDTASPTLSAGQRKEGCDSVRTEGRAALNGI